MMKRLALMFAATAVLAVPTSSAFAAPHRTNNVLPGQLCFAAYPWQAQPVLCGKGDGSKPEG